MEEVSIKGRQVNRFNVSIFKK